MKKYIIAGLLGLMIAAASAMQINGPLIGASLEKLSSAPSTPNIGRIYYDTISGNPKVCDGATCTSIGANIPGGATTQVQYNSSGVFAGDSGFTYNGLGTVTLSTKLSAPTITSSSLTASKPVFSDASDNLASGSVSGSTTKLVSTTGSLTAGDCVSIDASGNFIDNGSACSSISAGNLTDTGTDGIVVAGGTGAVIGSGTSITQHVSDSTHNGYLSSIDWSTFNGKQSALTIGNLTDVGTDGIVVSGGTGAVIGSGASLSQHVADTTHAGYLSSTDWNTFNGKQASGNYITALTGDVVASGPGSAAATIQSNVVTNAKLAQMAAHTYKGNNTGSTANSSDITSTQLTADLNQFTSSLQGLVPASGGGTSNFLRADGTWVAASSGTVTAVSVASANGFAGSSSGGATPALTLTTTVTGPLKGNGTAISAATSADIIALFTVCSGTQYLGADGSCHNSSGFNNPMTTFGDMIYENNSPVPSRVGGNTSASLAVLTQTGDGVASGVPAWSVLAAGSGVSLSGTTFSETYPIPSPSPSSVLMDKSGSWTPVPFPSPSPSGQFVMATGTGFTLSAAGGTPAGVSGNVQYNSSGSFAASNNLFWDIGNSRLGIGTSVPSVALDVNGAVRDRNLSTAGIVSTDSSGNLASASNASTFTTLYETIATTLGDLVYGGASGAPTRLAGNTQNSGYVLTSQASSGVATAPSWQPVSAIGISTDWSQAYTWTPATTPWGTIGANKIYSRRVGDSIQVQGYFVTGTVTANVASMALPSGLTIDSSKMGTATSATILGTYTSTTTSGTPQSIPASSWSGNVFYDGSDVNNVYFAIQVQSGQLVKNNANGIAVSGEPFAVSFTVPITGWSSNTIGASAGAVGATYYLSANWGGGANTSIPYDTKIVDTGCGGGTCIATGVGGTFKLTAPVTGNYAIDVCDAIASATSTNFQLYVNGSRVAYMNVVSATSTTTTCGSIIYPLTVGDFVDLRPDSGATIKGGAAGAILNWISFNLQSGNGGGNVSSSTTGSEHIERAHVTNNGSVCAITSQSGTWLSVNTRVGTGECKWNIAAGEFSAAPACTYTLDNQSGAMVALPAAANTNVLLDIVTVNTGRAVADYNYDMICMGPK